MVRWSVVAVLFVSSAMLAACGDSDSNQGGGPDGEGAGSSGGESASAGGGGGSADSCGDASCDADETCNACPSDCGVCPLSCGDAVCNNGETCDSCQGDCGLCGPWQPPIGIPSPSFGINEVAPAFTHYVDREDPACTDDGNDGTPALPRCTIPGRDGDPLAPGSVVEVHGRYDFAHTSPQDFHGQGTVDQPVFVRGESAANSAIMVAPLEVIGSSYVIFEHLQFEDADGDLDGGETGSFIITDKNGEPSASDHVVLRHSQVSGNRQGGGTGIGGYSGSTIVSHVVFYDNDIHDNGDYQATFDQDNHGTGIGTGAQYVWILDSQYHRNSGDGVQINGAVDNTHHIYLGRNIAYQNKQTGLWSKSAADVVFSQNVAYGHEPSDSSFGAGMGFQYDPQRVWFLYNESYDNSCGICSGSGADDTLEAVYLIGNVVHDTTGGAGFDPDDVWAANGINIRNGAQRFFVNNTLYRTYGGISCYYGGVCHLENNLIAEMSGGGHHFLLENDGSTVTANLMFQTSGSLGLQWSGDNYTSLQSFQSGSGEGEGCVTADPALTDAENGDFHTESGSPARDAGVVSSVYAAFDSLYGLSIAVDPDGNARPSGAAWDIGAFEQ